MTKKFDKKNLTKKAAPIRNAPVPEILCTDAFCNFKISKTTGTVQCMAVWNTIQDINVFALKSYQTLHVSAKC